MTHHTHTLPPCDCLDWCGDDERRIAQKQVQPCARFKERKLSAERDQLMYRLLHDMGHGVNMLAALQDLHQMRGERKVVMPLLRALADELAMIKPFKPAEAARLAMLLETARATLAGLDGQADGHGLFDSSRRART